MVGLKIVRNEFELPPLVPSRSHVPSFDDSNQASR